MHIVIRQLSSGLRMMVVVLAGYIFFLYYVYVIVLTDSVIIWVIHNIGDKDGNFSIR